MAVCVEYRLSREATYQVSTHLILTDTFRDKDLNDIFAQNVAWKAAQEERDPKFFEKLGSINMPNYMWIGRYQMRCFGV